MRRNGVLGKIIFCEMVFWRGISQMKLGILGFANFYFAF